MFRIRIHRIHRSFRTSERYGSGSGTSNHQAKIVRKHMISTVLLLLYDFLSVKNDVNVYLQKVISILKAIDKKSRIRIRISTKMSRLWNTAYKKECRSLVKRNGPHCKEKICRPIVGIYKSHSETWMWKLGLWPRSSFSGNICFEFSVKYLGSA